MGTKNKFKGSFKEVSKTFFRKFQMCFKIVSSMFYENYGKKVLKVFQECFVLQI